MTLRRTIQALIAAVLAVATCAITPLPVAAETAPELPIDVDLVHGFSVKSADIKTGTVVIWKNIEPVPMEQFAHTVTADNDAFDSGSLVPGARFTFTFNEPGTFTYKCTLHPQLMTAALNVTGEKIEPPALEKTVRIVEPSTNSNTWTYEPNDLLGSVGVKVTWRNDGAQPHNVTAEDGSIQSGDLASGASWTHTFTKPVSLRYICSLHTWMKGTVRISAADGTAPPPPPPAPKPEKPAFDPKSFGNSDTPSASAGPMTFKVGMVEPSTSDVNSWTFQPNTLNARVGDTVVWQNAGQAPHTATADDKSFDTGSIASGASYSLKLPKTGSFSYICTLHPWMKGKLVVAAAGTTAVLGNQTIGEPDAPGTTTDAETTDGGGSESATHKGAPVPPARRQLAIWVLIASAIMTGAMIMVARRDRTPAAPASGEMIETPDAAIEQEPELALV